MKNINRIKFCKIMIWLQPLGWLLLFDKYILGIKMFPATWKKLNKNFENKL